MGAQSLAIQNARQKAVELLKRIHSCIKDGYIDVEFLAEKNGISIKREKFDDQKISGYIQTKTNVGTNIVVNKDNSPERQRFTIAHELGHYFLHSAQSVHVDDIATTDLVLYRNEVSSQATHLFEIEANQFAAELLMPEMLISKDVERFQKENLGMSDIVEKLSKKYNVSQAAMAIRLNRI